MVGERFGFGLHQSYRNRGGVGLLGVCYGGVGGGVGGLGRESGVVLCMCVL